ncbi:helix-turn-helix domain-containing protein [Corynebacterium sp.]|uniref:helix-turn-helix domain-containing protein n=1 Tax=Corynebacterium sp. TaxID=1720 RepID=UPI0028B02449|nr:helix-turn-helix domain-containing protein [Corynebacterium sp.]
MNNHLPKLVKVSEFAEATGISKKATTSMILQGRIKAEKLNPGKRNSPYLIPRSEMQRFLDEVAA